jgi:hypothetical protein
MKAATGNLKATEKSVVQFPQSVQECVIFNRLELVSSAKQTPPFVGIATN